MFEDFVDFDTFCKSDFRVVKVEACEAVPKSKKLLRFTLNDGSDKKTNKKRVLWHSLFYKILLLVLTRSKNSVIIIKLFEGSGLYEKLTQKTFQKKIKKHLTNL